MRQKFGVDEHIEKVGWEHCCISEVTVAELLFGAERSNNVERNLQLVTDFCQDIKVIPLSSALCCYARSKAALYSQGTPIEDLDLFIGCTAVANQMIMVTENKKHLLEETKGKLSLCHPCNRTIRSGSTCLRSPTCAIHIHNQSTSPSLFNRCCHSNGATSAIPPSAISSSNCKTACHL